VSPANTSEPNTSQPGTLPKHEFLAGRLALDFCNSLSRKPRAGPPDRILKPADFEGWAERAGMPVERRPSPKALARLHRLRTALFAIFDALSDDQVPPLAALAILNAELAEARASERLVSLRKGFTIEDTSPNALERFRHAVARDAAELLTSDRRRIKRCPMHDCLWLFYDSSKNLSRRWCAMDDCGTLDKVRRFRERAE